MIDTVHLKDAHRFVAEAKERVLAQRELVGRLTIKGQRRTLAEDLLFAFERTLREMQISCGALGRGRANRLNTAVRPRLGLIRILRKLYAAKIDLAVGSDGHGGFTVGINKNGYQLAATKHFAPKELDLIAEWLERKALELYPREFA